MKTFSFSPSPHFLPAMSQAVRKLVVSYFFPSSMQKGHNFKIYRFSNTAGAAGRTLKSRSRPLPTHLGIKNTSARVILTVEEKHRNSVIAEEVTGTARVQVKLGQLVKMKCLSISSHFCFRTKFNNIMFYEYMFSSPPLGAVTGRLGLSACPFGIALAKKQGFRMFLETEHVKQFRDVG